MLVPGLSDDVAASLRGRLETSKLDIEPAVLNQCIVFSGHYVDPDAMAIDLPKELSRQILPGLRVANALWCPQAAAGRRIVDVARGTFRPSYTEILRDRVVQQRVSRAAME